MAPGDCIFCRIISGEIPAAKVLEDDACLAFLDIGPVAEGHTLLLPKVHAASIDDLTGDQAAATLRRLPELVRALKAVTGCQGVNVLQNNGRPAGQLVMHVHFHVIPRAAGDAFSYTWPAGEYPAGRSEQLVEALRRELAR